MSRSHLGEGVVYDGAPLLPEFLNLSGDSHEEAAGKPATRCFLLQQPLLLQGGVGNDTGVRLTTQ